MKFENTKIWGFEHALRGMRNPKNSWDRSDSVFGIRNLSNGDEELNIVSEDWTKYDGYEFEDENFNEHLLERENWLSENGILNLNPIQQIANIAYIGPKDMKLAQTLIKSGPEHRKFLRQIFVSVDITAPLYWWKQMDQYKIGTVTDSTSTMHKLTSKPITLDCFETDDWNPELVYYNFISPDGTTQAENTIEMLSDFMIEQLEFLRQKYLETKDKRYWKELVRWLPESWLQMRTWSANYEVVRSICQQRRNHKLNEWAGKDDPSKNNFIKWARERLPYAQYLIFDDENIPFQIEK